jgi:putative tributyrin esterase
MVCALMTDGTDVALIVAKGTDMALCEIHFPAPSLGKQCCMNVILPDGKGPFGVLYLLHGLSDDYSTWVRRSNIERHAAQSNLIVVMPDGHRSWYCNWPGPVGQAYEDHIVKDVVGFIDRTFHTIAHGRSRAIAGLSMGGYGAIMLAMRHSGMFSVAASHSGAVGFAHSPALSRQDVHRLAIPLPPNEYDCYRLATKCAKAGVKLNLRLDCGTEDFLIEENRLFVAHLRRLGLKHEYQEYGGAHNWDYWDLHICDTLSFVTERLKKK